jgi:hypothetical protein
MVYLIYFNRCRKNYKTTKLNYDQITKIKNITNKSIKVNQNQNKRQNKEIVVSLNLDQNLQIKNLRI